MSRPCQSNQQTPHGGRWCLSLRTGCSNCLAFCQEPFNQVSCVSAEPELPCSTMLHICHVRQTYRRKWPKKGKNSQVTETPGPASYQKRKREGKVHSHVSDTFPILHLSAAPLAAGECPHCWCCSTAAAWLATFCPQCWQFCREPNSLSSYDHYHVSYHVPVTWSLDPGKSKHKWHKLAKKPWNGPSNKNFNLTPAKNTS